MAESVAGLFGMSPEELQVQLRKEAEAKALAREQQIGQMGSGLGGWGELYRQQMRGQDQLYGNIDKALGLFGGAPAQDPRMVKAMAMQDIVKSYGDKDISDPAVLKSLIGDLQKGGFTKEAFGLLGTYDTLQNKGKAISKQYQLKNGDPVYEKNGKLYDMNDKPVKSGELVYIYTNPLTGMMVRGLAGQTTAPGATPAADGKGKTKPNPADFESGKTPNATGAASVAPAGPAMGGSSPTVSRGELNAMVSAARKGDTNARKYLEEIIQSGELSVGQRQAAEAALRGE